jgi:hypothetical protein
MQRVQHSPALQVVVSSLQLKPGAEPTFDPYLMLLQFGLYGVCVADAEADVTEE